MFALGWPRVPRGIQARAASAFARRARVLAGDHFDNGWSGRDLNRSSASDAANRPLPVAAHSFTVAFISFFDATA
jgi:hypothetical protein